MDGTFSSVQWPDLSSIRKQCEDYTDEVKKDLQQQIDDLKARILKLENKQVKDY